MFISSIVMLVCTWTFAAGELNPELQRNQTAVETAEETYGATMNWCSDRRTQVVSETRHYKRNYRDCSRNLKSVRRQLLAQASTHGQMQGMLYRCTIDSLAFRGNFTASEFHADYLSNCNEEVNRLVTYSTLAELRADNCDAELDETQDESKLLQRKIEAVAAEYDVCLRDFAREKFPESPP